MQSVLIGGQHGLSVSGKMSQKIDVIGETLGNFGKWQIRAMLIVFLCKIPTSWFMAVVIFTATVPNPGDFWCKPPAALNGTYKTEWIERAHPVKIGKNHMPKIDYCNVYRDVYENPLHYFGHNETIFSMHNLTTMKCPEYEYSPDYRSLTGDFTMMCGRDVLLPITQMFHILGLCVGGFIAFHMLK